MQNTIVLTFRDVYAEQSELLIALLGVLGFEAFEEKEDQLIACISEPEFDEASVREVLMPFSVNYDKEVAVPRNWNAEWEQQYQPVILNDFAGIRADFHPPLTGVQYEIVITPKMSFGTGHHATTRLMMQAMKHIDFTEKKVFDFGTGTGVLAILASMLGAAYIDAMDIDDWVVDNALENIDKNNQHNIRAFVGAEPLQHEKYDVVIANINRHILLEHMLNMRTVLKSDGCLLMSGFYEEDIPVLEAAANEAGLYISSSDLQDRWACLILQANDMR
ncbi:MAG: 50S ribosomal protein L11 methyltransferase [Bacteroidota bacterium]